MNISGKNKEEEGDFPLLFLYFMKNMSKNVEKKEEDFSSSLPDLSLFSFRKIKRRDEEDEIYIFLVSSFFLLLFLPFSSFFSESENLIVRKKKK